MSHIYLNIIYETGLALCAFFKEMAEQILKILVSGERQIYPPGLHAAFLHLTPGVTGPSTFKLINSAAICWPQGRHHCGRKPNYIKGLQFKLLVSGIEWVSHASWHFRSSLLKVTVWKYTNDTQERSHLPAPIVTSHLKQVVIWRIMKGSSQRRIHLPAPKVTRHLGIVVNWRYTRGFTRDRSHVTRHLHKVAVWRYTIGHTQERSHIYMFQMWQII